jgi:hypothetical protein
MVLSALGVPRISPLAVQRRRLQRWLQAYAAYPARLIFAPAGCGKTTLLEQYTAASPGRTLYYSIPQGADEESVAAEIGALLRDEPEGRVELIVDHVDNGDAGVAEYLRQLVEDAGANVGLVYAGRSRERFQSARLIARGLAALCDTRRLAFDVEDARLLAEACGIEATDLGLRRLVEDTDGWPLALCQAVRMAAAESGTLTGAYELWRDRSAPFMRDFLFEQLSPASEEDRRLFWSLYEGKVEGSSAAQRLEPKGLFIFDDGHGALRLFRPLRPGNAQAANADASQRQPLGAPLVVRMFRSFEATIDGKRIDWVRRRDQQILKYLMLKPDGRATRDEIASVFWNDTERHLATQSVRTACSTIRKAFAGIVGPSAVDDYFRAVPDLQIDLRYTVCDVRRFIAHVADGRACMTNGDEQGAAMHFRAAEKLYAGDLLELESAEPWFAEAAQSLREQSAFVLEQLAEIAERRGEYSAARQYAHMRARMSEHRLQHA